MVRGDAKGAVCKFASSFHESWTSHAVSGEVLLYTTTRCGCKHVARVNTLGSRRNLCFPLVAPRQVVRGARHDAAGSALVEALLPRVVLAEADLISSR